MKLILMSLLALTISTLSPGQSQKKSHFEASSEWQFNKAQESTACKNFVCSTYEEDTIELKPLYPVLFGKSSCVKTTELLFIWNFQNKKWENINYEYNLYAGCEKNVGSKIPAIIWNEDSTVPGSYKVYVDWFCEAGEFPLSTQRILIFLPNGPELTLVENRPAP